MSRREELDVGGGRTLHVPKSLKGVAVFSFKRLCGEARGAADYLAIARRFHTVIIVGIPVLSREMRNEAARFVTLIDALYEHRVKLLAAADAEPGGLYPGGRRPLRIRPHGQPARGNAERRLSWRRPRPSRGLTRSASRLASPHDQGRIIMRPFARRPACYLLSTAAIAAPPGLTPAQRAATHAMFETCRSTYRPSIGRHAGPEDGATIVADQFKAAGFPAADVHVMPYHTGSATTGEDETAALIVRWRAAGKPSARPILLMGHMDVVEAKREDSTHRPVRPDREGRLLSTAAARST